MKEYFVEFANKFNTYEDYTHAMISIVEDRKSTRERLKREAEERERLAREQRERERLAREQRERERLAREQREREERERLAREQREREEREAAAIIFKRKLIGIGILIVSISFSIYYAYNKYYPKYGTLTYENGDIYTGLIKNGIAIDDNGSILRVNGTMCKGKFIENKLNGHATCTYPKGGEYTGEFKNDARNGYGEFIFANGNIYKGNFVDNKLHGTGELFYKKTGVIYKGEFEQNQIKGDGVVIKDGMEYCKGQFTNLTMTCTMNSNLLYSGKYKEETFDFKGQGILTDTTTGEKYIGNFKNNEFHGYGEIFDKHGKLLFEGKFENGEAIIPKNNTFDDESVGNNENLQ